MLRVPVGDLMISRCKDLSLSLSTGFVLSRFVLIVLVICRFRAASQLKKGSSTKDSASEIKVYLNVPSDKILLNIACMKNVANTSTQQL